MTGNSFQLEEELQVLESIYPDYILESSSVSLRLEVPVELDSPRTVSTITSISDTNKTDSGSSTGPSYLGPSLQVSYLPPIIFSIQFPDGYPSERPPIIASIHTTHRWLPNEAQVADTLREAWTEGEGVLCTWIELVRSGEFLERLKLIDESGAIRLPRTASQPQAQFLLEYDSNASARRFSQNSYPCSICFASLKGTRCIQLECSHVFCRSCLQEFWNFCIAEGSVERVGCADPACVKEGRLATEEELRRVVGDKEIIRWKWLKAKEEIEKDPSIVHCPIPTCQAAVRKPPTDSKASSGWDRFRSCSTCGFNFCAFCKHTWHGPISECPKSITLSLVLEYLDLPDGSQERAALERKFGKGVVLRLVKDYQNEKLTADWLQNSTTTCPGCQVPVEKSMGCNHMMCAKCNQHFCYRCGARLSAFDPYKHFSAKGSKCFGKLFDIERSAEDDGWQAVEWFEAL